MFTQFFLHSLEYCCSHHRQTACAKSGMDCPTPRLPARVDLVVMAAFCLGGQASSLQDRSLCTGLSYQLVGSQDFSFVSVLSTSTLDPSTISSTSLAPILPARDSVLDRPTSILQAFPLHIDVIPFLFTV